MSSPFISANWLKEHLEKETLIVLDASSRPISSSERDVKIAIPGAQYFDLGGTFSEREAKYPNTFPSQEQFNREAKKLGVNQNSLIVVYDDKGIFNSARVRWMFRTMGLGDVYVLDGGLPGWIQAGFKTVDSYREPLNAGNFHGNIKKNRVVGLDFIQSEARMNECVLADARSMGRFSGTAPEPRAGLRSGSIPGSINIPFQSLLADGFVRPKEEIAPYFEWAKDSTRQPIFTCGSGVTACIIGMVYEWLVGNDEYAVYDGSWTEYASETAS